MRKENVEGPAHRGGRIKPENEKIDYIVDAVGAEKKISFSCFRFNGRRQQKPKNSGAE